MNLSLSEPTGGATLGPRSTSDLTIIDSDVGGSVKFSLAAYSRSETGGLATITVTRTGGSASGVTVDFDTMDLTATAGEDYTAVPATLVFASNQVSQTVLIPVLNDSLAEGNEAVQLTLRNPGGGATLGVISNAVLTIIDNDLGGIIQFSAITYTITEAGPAASIIVTRTGGAASGVSVRFETRNGTATAGADYTAVSSTINFAANEVAKTVLIPIVNDNLVEGNETVNLSLSAPTGGATLGPRRTSVLTITGR